MKVIYEFYIFLKKISPKVFKEKRKFLIYFILAILFVGAKQAFPLILKEVVDKLIPEKNLSVFNIYLILLVFLKIFEFISGSVNFFIGILISTKFILNLKIDFLKNFFNLSPSFINNQSSGSIMQRLDGDINSIQTVIFDNFLSFIVDMLQLLWLFPILLWLDYRLAIIMILTMPINGYLSFYYGKKIRSETKEFSKVKDKVNSFLLERIKNYQLVKYNASEKFEIGNFIKLFRNYIKSLFKISCYKELSSAFYYLSIEMTPIIILFYGGYLVFKGETTLGTILAITNYCTRLFYPIKSIFNFLNSINQAIVSTERYYEYFDCDLQERSEGLKQVIKGNITFDKVNFGYQDRNLILKDLSFTINEGEVIGIVGKSGIGKSTLINLLLGLYSPLSGKIIIDDIDIKDLELKNLRKQTNVVTQNIFLLDDSIKTNILYNNFVSDEKLNQIYHLTQLHELINSLPNNHDTKIGENGIKLSGGEKQRLAIARALVKPGNLYIFDEATSQIDVTTENIIWKNIMNYINKKTVIIIAHRLSTIVNADKILVLHNGEIFEHGNHEQLINKKGLYYQMWQNIN